MVSRLISSCLAPKAALDTAPYSHRPTTALRDGLALFGLAVSLILWPLASLAQVQQDVAPQDSFASENAILDTSILFSIGAREARQELRGAFGWPTFQEGLVEGVYFRFDPDGYARFAPSPRLDSDVFEVICRPRTYACMGRKGAMSVTLNARGQIQLQLENVVENDRFFVMDGISELQLPTTLLQPLEPRLELLLSSGGELLVRRGDNEVDRISLLGFSAVVTYLRWVTAKQDYTVLPRGWPVPNSTNGNTPSGLTQATVWQSPMPQPHVVIQTVPGANVAAQTLATRPTHNTTGTNSADMEGAVTLLNELLHNRQQHADAPSGQGDNSVGSNTSRLEELQTMVKLLTYELHRLQNGNQTATGMSNQMVGQTNGQTPSQMPPQITLGGNTYDNTTQAAPVMAPAANMPNQGTPSNARTLAMRLEYLIEEIGLQPEVALMLVQQGQEAEAASPLSPEQSDVVSEILNELKSQIPPSPSAEPAPIINQASDTGYQLLGDYLKTFSQP